MREETRCRHMGYSFRLTARVLLYAPSHRQDSTYHGLCYTSRGALAGTRNSSMGPPHVGSIRRPIAPWDWGDICWLINAGRSETDLWAIYLIGLCYALIKLNGSLLAEKNFSRERERKKPTSKRRKLKLHHIDRPKKNTGNTSGISTNWNDNILVKKYQ